MKTFALSLFAAAATAVNIQLSADLEASGPNPNLPTIWLEHTSSDLLNTYKNDGICIEYN